MSAHFPRDPWLKFPSTSLLPNNCENSDLIKGLYSSHNQFPSYAPPPLPYLQISPSHPRRLTLSLTTAYLQNSPPIPFCALNSVLTGSAHFSISGKKFALQGIVGRALKSRSIVRRFTASQKNLGPRSTAITAFLMSATIRRLLESSLHL